MLRRGFLLPIAAIAMVSDCGGRVIEGGAAGDQATGGESAGGGSHAGRPGNGGVAISTGGRKAGTGGIRMGTGGQGGFGGVFGAGGLVGTCNPSFCQGTPNGKPCCMSPNGPCGVDYGSGCGAPGQCVYDSDCPPVPAPCQPCPDGSCAAYQTRCVQNYCSTVFDACPAADVCTPGFCPPVNNGKGCCISSVGPCGVDYGNGCVPLCTQNDCLQPDPSYAWRQGCVPPVCRDAGPTFRVCRGASKEVVGAPCASPGELCTVDYGCTEVLICATPYTCPIPL